MNEFHQRLESIDQLYQHIRRSGFSTNPDEFVDTYSHRSSFFRMVMKMQNKLEFISINIGRNGESIVLEGKHRVSVAKVLGIKKVPVIVRVRHKLWVEKRKKVINSPEFRKDSELNTHFDIIEEL